MSDTTKQRVWAGVGVVLLLLAVYLPELGAAGWVETIAGKEDADHADVVVLARWVLVVAGLTLLAWPGRGLALEAVLAGAAVLTVIAVAGATIELGARVIDKDDATPDKGDVTRSFAIPAAKVQTVAGDLPAGCVRVLLVRGADEDADDDSDALTYSHEDYDAGRLPAEVKAGKPSDPVTVEIDDGDDPEDFATDLTAADAAYLLGC